ncbi:MAG: PAS domain S-box protein [Cytophagaceae bacterium]
MITENPKTDYLSQPEEQYKLLVDSVKDYAIFMLDPHGYIVTWNPGAQRLIGYIPAEIIGKHFSVFYPKEQIDIDYPTLELKKAIEKGRFEDEGWRVRKDKSIYWANVIITPIYHDDQLIGFSKVTRDLTERKKAENEILKIQQQNKLLIQGITTIKDYSIIILDENGHISNWNEGAERLMGYKFKEVVGRYFSLFYPQDAIEAGYAEYELEKAIEDGRFEDEGWRVRKDGTQFWANVIITPIILEKKLIGFSKVTQDLTHRKLAEQKIKETEDKYKLLIDSILDYCIFMLDPDGYISSINKGVESILGYTSEDIIGKHISKFYPKKYIDSGYPEYEIKEAGEKGRFEDQGWRLKKDGTLIWVHVVLTPIYKNNKIIGFSKVTKDLTQQKKIEKALKESEERYRLLVNGIKDYAIFMIDNYGYVNTWNSGAKNITGYENKEIIGRHFSVFFTEEDVSAGLPEYELIKAREAGRYEHEGWRVKKGGERYWANTIVNSISNQEGKVIGFSKITRDLTDIKKAETDLVKKNAELSKVNADLDNFIYTASHDLKAPISNIEGLLSVLAENIDELGIDDHQIKNLLTMMDISVQRFRKTIFDLTEVTKLQRHFYEDESELEMQPMVDEILDSISTLISGTNAIVNVNICSRIRFSKHNIRTILYNLISNAIKYRHPERKPIVEVSCKELEDHYLISVKDNGLGIPDKSKDKLFSMFKRFHDHVEGTGIGLFLVKRIIDNADGKIEVFSKEGEGATFNVYLKKSKQIHLHEIY